MKRTITRTSDIGITVRIAFAIFPKSVRNVRIRRSTLKIRTTRKVRIALKTFVVTPAPRSEVSMANMSTMKPSKRLRRSAAYSRGPSAKTLSKNSSVKTPPKT